MNPSRIHNKAFLDIIVQVAGKVIGSLLGLLAVMQLSRYLNVEQFGAYTLAFSIAGLFQPLVDMGMNTIAIREITRKPESESAILTGAIMSKFLLSILSLVLIVVLLTTMGYPTEIRLLTFIGGMSLFASVVSTYEVLLVAKHQIYRAAVSQLIGSVFHLAIVTVLIKLNSSLAMLVASQVFSLLLSAILIVAQIRHTIRWTLPEFVQLRAFWVASFPQGVASLITVFYYNIDMVLVSKFLDTASVGYYGAAYRLFGFVVFIPHAVMLSFYPQLVRARELSRESFENVCGTTFGLLLLVALPLAVWIQIYAEPLVTMIYSSAYKPAADVLPILGWAGVAVFASHLSGYALVAISRQTIGILISFCALASNLLLNVVLIPSKGIYGAALATLLTESLVACLGFVLFFRFSRVLPFSSRLYHSILAALLTTALAWLFQDAHWLIASAAIGATLAAMFCFLFWRTAHHVSYQKSGIGKLVE